MDQKTPTPPPLRLTVLVVLLLAGAALAVAQTMDTDAVPLSLADLDLSDASIHQAGPASFYVRAVGVDDDAYSFLIEQAAGDAWSVTRIIPERANILPPETILDFATVSVTEDNRIRIDGVLVGERVYSGSLAVGDDANLELAEQIEVSSRGPLNEARAQAVREILAAETRTELETSLQEQLDYLQDVVDRIGAQRDTYREERDQLAERNEELAAERDALETERERLERQLTEDAPATPLTGEQVQALVKERDQLAGDIVGLVTENNELRAERRSLREQIDELEQRNAELQGDIATMTSEVARLGELVQAYRSAQAEPSDAAEPSLPSDYVRTRDLEQAATAVTGELRALEARLASLERAASGLAELEDALRTGVRRGLPGARLAAEPVGDLPGTTDEADPGVPRAEPGERAPLSTDETAEPEPRPHEEAEPESPRADEAAARLEQVQAEHAEEIALLQAEHADDIARLQEEVAELLEANETLRREKQELEERVLNEILDNGFVQMMRERLSRNLVRGFEAGAPDTGTWEVTRARARQTDGDAFFAKLAMPAEQEDGPVLYSFRVRSLDREGWVGFGLHLFVEEVEKRRGYGMGSSLLVWLTRDPQLRKSGTTYLQLYKSNDDVHMERVLDAAIPEGVNEEMQVDVLYEPESQYITIAVDGSDRVRYRTWFGVDSGVELALRALGRAEFREFTVRTAPVAP